MKKTLAVVLGLLLLLCLASGVLAREKAVLWDGNDWGKMPMDAKIGYIWGIGNMADFEVAASGNRTPPCISTAFVNELKNKTVLQIVQEVDKYYKEGSDKAKTPVLEVVLRRCTSVCPPEASAGGQKK